jgi:uncharacterized protein YgiM (DUF1202 family)
MNCSAMEELFQKNCMDLTRGAWTTHGVALQELRIMNCVAISRELHTRCGEKLTAAAGSSLYNENDNTNIRTGATRPSRL